MSNILPPPPDRPGLGSTFKRPLQELIVGDANGFIDISGKIPAELVAYYTAHWGGVLFKASIRFFVVDGGLKSYYYMVAGTNSIQSFDLFATGWVDPALTVHESNIVQLRTGSINNIYGNVDNSNIVMGVGGTIQMQNDSPIQTFDAGGVGRFTLHGNLLTAFAGAIISILSGAIISVINGGAINMHAGSVIAYDNTAQMTYSGKAMPRGFKDFGHTTASSAALSTTFVNVCQSDATRTFENGRAYEFTCTPSIASSVAGIAPRWNVSQLSNGNTVSTDTAMPLKSTTGNEQYVLTTIFVNTSGNDIALETMQLFMRSGTAGQTITVFGSAGHPLYFDIKDIGAATDFAGMPSMT